MVFEQLFKFLLENVSISDIILIGKDISLSREIKWQWIL